MVNLLPAVLVGGPPHAGKSVLFYQLTQALRLRGIDHHAIRACPDGEGNWFHEGEPETVSKIRVKLTGEWPASFVQRLCQDLEQRNLPFLVDMGGNPKASQESLLRLCTHAILLLRQDKPEAAQRWDYLVESSNLLPLARLLSEQNGPSVITDYVPVLKGTITGLMRHVPNAGAGALFDELVNRVASLFSSYELSDRRKMYLEHASTELVLDLDEALRSLAASATRWEASMVQPFLESLPAQTPLSVYGVGPSWLYAALAAYAYPEPFYLFDPKLPFGWVEPIQVAFSNETSPEVQVTFHTYEETTVLTLAFPNDRISYFQPEPLPFPPVPTDRGMIIDGRAPNWLLTALVRLYQAAGLPWVAPYYAQANRAVVVYSHVEQLPPGALVPKP